MAIVSPPSRVTSPSKWAMKKTLFTFHYTGWFIGILKMGYYIPWVGFHPRFLSLLNHGFFHCSNDLFMAQKLGVKKNQPNISSQICLLRTQAASKAFTTFITSAAQLQLLTDGRSCRFHGSVVYRSFGTRGIVFCLYSKTTKIQPFETDMTKIFRRKNYQPKKHPLLGKTDWSVVF